MDWPYKNLFWPHSNHGLGPAGPKHTDSFFPPCRGDSTTPTSDHNHLGATSKLTTTMRKQLLLHQKNYHQGQFRQIIVGLL